MSKEETKCANPIELIEVDVVKSDLKKVLQAHKRFSIQGKNVEGSVLSGINFTVKADELILKTTDGNRALISRLHLQDSYGKETGEFTLSMALVSKLSFVKGELDIIRIVSNGSTVEFVDFEYNSTQKLTIRWDKNFPKIDDVIPTKNNFSVTVSQKLIKDISSLKAQAGALDISFNTNNKLAAILVETASENVKQQAILMPIDKQEKED